MKQIVLDVLRTDVIIGNVCLVCLLIDTPTYMLVGARLNSRNEVLHHEGKKKSLGSAASFLTSFQYLTLSPETLKP